MIRKRAPRDAPGPLPVIIEEQSLEPGDALKAEIESFLDCIRAGRAPVVTGEAGLMALETAMRITEQVQRSLAAKRAWPSARSRLMAARRSRLQSPASGCRQRQAVLDVPATGAFPAGRPGR